MINMGRKTVGFRLHKRFIDKLDEAVGNYPQCTGRSELVREVVKIFLYHELNSDREEVEVPAAQGVGYE